MFRGWRDDKEQREAKREMADEVGRKPGECGVLEAQRIFQGEAITCDNT